jgi:hypothetical protein
MSNFSFMQSGLTGGDGGEFNEMEDLKVMLSLFISNAMINAARFVKICGRDGVTKMDIEYCLKYEVFEFFNNPNLTEHFNDMKQDYLDEEEDEEEEEEDDSGGILWCTHPKCINSLDSFPSKSLLKDHMLIKHDYEEIDSGSSEDNDVAEYEYEDTDAVGDGEEDEVDGLEELVVPDDEIQTFTKIELDDVDGSDKEFVETLYKHYDYWGEWTPTTPIEISLYNAIQKIA